MTPTSAKRTGPVVTGIRSILNGFLAGVLAVEILSTQLPGIDEPGCGSARSEADTAGLHGARTSIPAYLCPVSSLAAELRPPVRRIR